METHMKVTFQPQGRSVSVLCGTTILEAAARAGLMIETPCGGAGTCGKCRVRVVGNAGVPTVADEKVVFDGDVRMEVIGNAAASGIGGSGLIDLVAELLTHGIVSPEGQLLSKDELPPTLAPALARRVQEDEDGETRFVVTDAMPGRATPPVFLTQRDIREVQLGSGAIRAGISILLRKAGLEVADLKTVLIAGGFGNFIRRSSAQRIGLLPAGIDHQRIRYVGNASLAGAKASLLSTEARRRGEDMARRARHVDLSTAEGFHEEFAEAMIFPS